MYSKVVTLLALSFLGVVCAQNATGSAPAIPTSTSGIPTCVLNCTSTAAAQTDCKTITNATCVCTSQKFQSTAAACLKTCSTADQQAAVQFQTAICSSIASNGTATGSGSAKPTATAPASGNGTSGNTTTGTNSTGTNGTSPSAPKSAAMKAFEIGAVHAIGAVTVVLAMISGAVALF